jgi:hypothetical protein
VREQRPAPKPKPVRPLIETVDDRGGRYASKSGRWLEIHVLSSGLAAQIDGRTIGLDVAGDDVLIAKDPAATPYSFVFRRRLGRAERVWWGETEFVRDDVRPLAFSPSTPPALKALTGRYECDDPWRGVFTVLAQGEHLFVDGAMPLTALPDGSYRVGDRDWSPDRLRFDAAESGKPQRAVFSGVDYQRREV